MTAALSSPPPSAPRRAARVSASALACLLAGLPSAAGAVPDTAGRMWVTAQVIGQVTGQVTAQVTAPVTALAGASWSEAAQAGTRTSADPAATLTATVSVPDASDAPDASAEPPDAPTARLAAPAPASAGRALLASVAGGLVLCVLGWRHARAPRRGGVRPR
ncbi:MAG: hypothetical protein RLY78_3402 [Pseudomonadota bacterium]|jgi:hypothetical protein